MKQTRSTDFLGPPVSVKAFGLKFLNFTITLSDSLPLTPSLFILLATSHFITFPLCLHQTLSEADGLCRCCLTGYNFVLSFSQSFCLHCIHITYKKHSWWFYAFKGCLFSDLTHFAKILQHALLNHLY